MRQAVIEDAAQLAPRLRASDLAEIQALTDEDPTTVLRASVEGSRFVWAATYGGEVMLLLGTSDAPDGSGCIWMMGAEGVNAQGGALTSIAVAHIDLVRKFYPALRNLVHAANTVSVRWIARLGFDVSPPAPHGPKGELFHAFALEG